MQHSCKRNPVTTWKPLGLGRFEEALFKDRLNIFVRYVWGAPIQEVSEFMGQTITGLVAKVEWAGCKSARCPTGNWCDGEVDSQTEHLGGSMPPCP